MKDEKRIVTQILLGSLLGDGCIAFSKRSINPYYTEQHSIKQKKYLLWKNKFLNFKVGYLVRKDKRNGKKYNHIYIYGNKKKNKSLNKFYNLFYKNKKKRINNEILDKIEKIGLVVWLCDDGSYNYYTKIFSLFTDAFSFKEQLLIQKWFKNKFKINPDIVKKKNNHFYLRFRVIETHKLINLIKNIIPKCMNYKIGLDINKIKFTSNKAKKRRKKDYKKNRDKILKTRKKYYEKNRDKIKIREKEYHKKNKDKRNKRSLEYYYKNKKEINRKHKMYMKKYRRTKEALF